VNTLLAYPYIHVRFTFTLSRQYLASPFYATNHDPSILLSFILPHPIKTLSSSNFFAYFIKTNKRFSIKSALTMQTVYD
jgi:hypothetical protein